MKRPLKIGDAVSVKGWGRGIVIGVEGDNIYARTEDGEVLAHIYEVRRSRNTKPLFRDVLPYALFTCADGREVLVNRGYSPLWTRTGPGAKAVKAKADEHVANIVAEAWFWLDKPPHRSRKAREAAEAALQAFFDGRPINPAIVAHVEARDDGK